MTQSCILKYRGYRLFVNKCTTQFFFTRFSRVLLPRGRFIYQTHVKNKINFLFAVKKVKLFLANGLNLHYLIRRLTLALMQLTGGGADCYLLLLKYQDIHRVWSPQFMETWNIGKNLVKSGIWNRKVKEFAWHFILN